MYDPDRGMRANRIVCGILGVIFAIISLGGFYDAGVFG